MSPVIVKLLDAFKNKINVLIIDDDPIVLDAIADMFSSPLFSVTSGSTCAQAFEKINTAPSRFHCWILDIALEEEKDGFTILKKHPHFPYIIMLSGLHSMTVATEALTLGAMKVYDKNPSSLDALFEDVCKIAALGFLLQGKYTDYLTHFLCMFTNLFTSHNEWAEKACISVLQLERICSSHTNITARLVLPFYYTLYALLNDDLCFELEGHSDQSHRPDLGRYDFYLSHMRFVENHFDKYSCFYSSLPV